MNKQKWAKERVGHKLLRKLQEETGEVLLASADYEDPVGRTLEELDHVIFIAERLKAVLNG